MRKVLLLSAVVGSTALASCGGDSTTIQVTPTQPTAESTSQTTLVPTVIGKDEDQAKSILGSAGFESVEVESVPNDAPSGTVLEQGPPAGSSVADGSTVTLTVSSGLP